jgi:phosphatidylglycerol:prolipoprotein diacylglycerol transferase
MIRSCIAAQSADVMAMHSLGFYVHHLSPNLITFTNSLAVRWYGLAYVLGFYLAFLVMRHLSRRGLSEIKEDAVADFITMTAIFGVVIGGRVGYMLFYNFDAFIHQPWIIIYIWDGGMASHGGMVGVLLFVIWYARRHRISWLGLGDTLVCGAPLGLLTGRIANFINGELFGRITDVPWAVKFPTEIHHSDFLQRTTSDLPFARFPHNSPDILAFYQQNFGDVQQFIDLLHPRHPSQLYEAAGEGLFLFLVMITLRLKFPRLPHGTLSGLFWLLYAVVRIALENYREPDSGAEFVMGLTKGQFLSTFMVVAGVSFIVIGRLTGKPLKAPADSRV